MKTGLRPLVLSLALFAPFVAAAGGPAAAAGPPAGRAAPPAASIVRWAEQPEEGPNYIFPINSCCYSPANINDFQQLMYRPLYWFGTGSQPALNTAESLAAPPTYRGDTVVVDLKPGLVWSDGEPVDAADVVFFMNLLRTVRTADWADYTPGYFPDNVSDVTATGPDQVTFTLSGTVDPAWFTGDELSQITPLPIAWDIAAGGAQPGSGGCSAAAFDTITVSSSPSQPIVPTSPSAQACYDVYEYLADPFSGQAANASTYASNPLWGIVDGPWRLRSLDEATGTTLFVANPAYAGPQKPWFHEFEEVGFPSEEAEYEALLARQVDVGYLPLQNAPQNNGNPLDAGPNAPELAASYVLKPQYLYEIEYLPLNFQHPTAGPLFAQLYLRAALQSLVDQQRLVREVDAGYGVPTTGPVPTVPPIYASPGELVPPYPYDPARAKALLSSHGWNVVPGGTSTCVRPGTAAGDCGAGISEGAPLRFTLLSVTENGTFQEVEAMAAAWELAGIHVTLKFETFASVVATTAVNCFVTGDCSWQAGDWSGGWLFEPDYYPTGEQLFDGEPGCSSESQLVLSNAGAYCDATNHANIVATVTGGGRAALARYEDYLARQVPVLWQPLAVNELMEVKVGLAGVTPSPFGAINPEYWRTGYGGYWLAARDGQVVPVGSAPAIGSAQLPHGVPLVGIAATSDRKGYWVVGADGAVRALGDARFEGDLPALHVAVDDIVAVAPTADGRGYWLIGADGGEFAFGDARFHGSLPGLGLHVRDVVGMVGTADAGGYWLVGADGGVFAFGDARYRGSLPALGDRVRDIRAMVASPSRGGYLLVGADGGTFLFGSGTAWYGSLPQRGIRVSDVVGLALDADRGGYWLAGADGSVYAFGDAGVFPAPAAVGANLPVAAVAGA